MVGTFLRNPPHLTIQRCFAPVLSCPLLAEERCGFPFETMPPLILILRICVWVWERHPVCYFYSIIREVVAIRINKSPSET